MLQPSFLLKYQSEVVFFPQDNKVLNIFFQEIKYVVGAQVRGRGLVALGGRVGHALSPVDPLQHQQFEALHQPGTGAEKVLHRAVQEEGKENHGRIENLGQELFLQN